MSTATRQRPAYLDGLFAPSQSVDQRPRTPSLSRSLYSSTESINAMSHLDTQQNLNHTRPLTPACEEELEEANSSGDDSKSVLSLSLAKSLKPRLRLRNFSLHRRSDPTLQRSNSSRPTSGDSSSSKISPKAATFFHGKRHSNPTHAPNKPLPALPTQETQSAVQAQELTCHRCYYFAARNCKGWTMGGSSNDACEACLVSSHSSTSPLRYRQLTTLTASWFLRCSLIDLLRSSTLILLFPFLFCSLAMNFSAAPWDGGDGRHCDDILAGLCLFFPFSFLLHNLRQTPRLEFPARNGLIFFSFSQQGCMMTGWQDNFRFTSTRCMSAQVTHKKGRDKRTQVQL
jgi:hypothetical protein